MERVMDGREEDVAVIRRWFQRLTDHVQAVDYVGATFADFVTGRDAIEKQQWRKFGAPSTTFAAASTKCVRSFPRTGSPPWA
jgi:hypothetical protein